MRDERRHLASARNVHQLTVPVGASVAFGLVVPVLGLTVPGDGSPISCLVSAVFRSPFHVHTVPLESNAQSTTVPLGNLQRITPAPGLETVPPIFSQLEMN